MLNFLKHELKALGSAVGSLVTIAIIIMLINIIIGLGIVAVLLPIGIIIGRMPGWAFWVELGVLLLLLIASRYIKFKKRRNK